MKVLGDTRKGRFDPDLAARINKQLGTIPVTTVQQHSSQVQYHVPYDDRYYTVDLLNRPLAEHTLTHWLELQSPPEDFVPGDLPLHFAYFRILYHQKDNYGERERIENIRKFVCTQFGQQECLTLTHQIAPASGFYIKHNFQHRNNTLKIPADLSDNITILQALFDTQDLNEVFHVFDWLFDRTSNLTFSNRPNLATLRASPKKYTISLADAVWAYPALGFRLEEELI
jgi:hypothetical protein